MQIITSTDVVTKLLAQRLALGLLSMFVVSVVIFVAVNSLPGSFAAAVLGQSATPEAVAAFNQKLGLDQPLVSRYLTWLSATVTGDFGTSFTNRPVSTMVMPRLWNSLKLAISAALIAVPLAITLGAICVRFVNRLPDRILSATTLSTISLPEFFIAYLLILVLAAKLQLLPSLSTIRGSMGFADQAIRMILPVLTLVFVTLAHMMRATRAALLNVMAQPYIEMARLKGEPETRIILRHALPNAIGSIASVVALNLAYLIAGVVVVEAVFVYPGIGDTMVSAVSNRDIPVVQACALIFSAAYILLNLVADIIAIASNPRLMHAR
ncbi:ABC transporter permease [Shinella curvata]|uniref:ABC transporter permease n=1 Tax=Shinella curvata TaxID=1817964 RepID=A0ABT8XBD8_9HYPH|nr:ABC transporter permease [Shinella curvata]MCJ8054643.1 ABC transporter permease [Shinella curvata]MDO6120962.1 ABC transporter permease [Shinella curvata]